MHRRTFSEQSPARDRALAYALALPFCLWETVCRDNRGNPLFVVRPGAVMLMPLLDGPCAAAGGDYSVEGLSHLLPRKLMNLPCPVAQTYILWLWTTQGRAKFPIPLVHDRFL